MTTTDEAREVLKPCPFCGAKDGRLVQAFTRATDTFAYWSVECLDCACEIASDASQAEADAAWNTRAQPIGSDVLREATLRNRFTDALNAIPWLAGRIALGQQFNAYERSTNDEDDEDEDREFYVGVGPVSDFRYLLYITGRAEAKLLESALKIAALATQPNEPLTPDAERVRHRKRGTEYTVIGTGRAQGELRDEDLVVIYQGDDGQFWVRGSAEFDDGRFERLTPDTLSPSPLHEGLIDPAVPRSDADYSGYAYSPADETSGGDK